MSLIKIQEPGIVEKNEQATQEVVIGIDLGTTNSLVAIVQDDKVKILADENGRDIIPSVVYYDKNGNLTAKESDHFFEISSVKRLMGKDKNLQIDVGGRKVAPEEVSAEILKYLKEIAKKTLRFDKLSAGSNYSDNNLEIKKAVITVPAYFDEAAKNATKLAAQLAGLEVLRLVNEPTAAALAYGLENSSEGIYCVYDLGGGTFDVSILKMQKGVFKVLGVAGDNNLGGDDFDEILAEKLGIDKKEARRIKEELSLHEHEDGVANPVQQQMPDQSQHSSFLDASASENLMMRSSKATPSRMTEGVVMAEGLRMAAEGSKTKITREEFEKLISEKIEKTITLTKNLIEDLELESEEIKGLILVGGSTRIPLVRKKLAEIFGEEKILTNLDPDRVVAIGAAWQAYNLSGNSRNLLLDVVPLSLGIEMMGGIVDKVILRNSTIPISATKEFTTYADNQNGIKLHIVQGERELAQDCRSLANFEIKNIPAMKAGLARVAVTFKVDADGLLTVTAEERITKTKQEIEVKPTYGLDQNSIKKMLLDSLQNSKSDMEKRLLVKTVVDAQKDISILKKDLENSPELISEKERKIIKEKILELENLCKNSSDRDLIIGALSDLEKSAENLVLAKVNLAIKDKITGKNVDEV